MLERLKELARKYDLLQEQLEDPSVYGDPEKLKRLNREIRELGPVAEAYRRFEQLQNDCEEAEMLLSDPEMADIAKEEWMAAIEKGVPAKFLEVNKKAFTLGAAM